MRFRCYVDRLRAALQSLLPILLALSTGDAAAVAPMPDDGIKVTTKYPILDSGFPAVDQPSYLIWLDDYRVLFHGVDLEANVREPKAQLQTATHIWDTRKNAVTKYKQERLIDPCYDNGRIVYFTWDEAARKSTLYRGKFGEERGELLAVPRNWVWNPFDCSEIRSRQEPKKLLQEQGRNVVPLRREHGFVDIGPADAMHSRHRGADYQYRIISFDLRKATPISVDALLTLYPHQWIWHTGEYLFRDDGNSQPPHRVWIIALDGSARPVTLPSRDWPSRPSVIVAARPGIVFWVGSSWSSNSATPATQGLYLARAEGLEWLVQGVARNVSASPNGCRLAYSYSPSLAALTVTRLQWRDGRIGNTLRIMDFCASR